MNEQVREIFACRACGSADLAEVMNLGEQYLSTFPSSREEGERLGKKVPLRLVLCRSCKLSQLKHTTPPDWLYRQFWYKSGVTKTMTATLAGIAQEAEDFVKLREGDKVCDIGANDGTMLRCYRTPGITRVGYEPALNLVEEAERGGNVIVPEYFRANGAAHGRYKIVTAIAMFYDLDDPGRFLEDVRSVLHPDGVFILQMNYLPTMLRQCAFDNIGHEHLAYYSMTSLLPMLERHGLTAFRSRLNDVNGGSVQVWCSAYGRHSGPGPASLVRREERAKINEERSYELFAKRVADTGNAVHALLTCRDRESTYLCGASTRGNTLLQTFGIDHRMVAGAAERDQRKWGRVTPGTWIPIVSEEKARENAEAMLVLPWHFAEEITAREMTFLQGGGTLIFPLPRPKVVRAPRTAAA